MSLHFIFQIFYQVVKPQVIGLNIFIKMECHPRTWFHRSSLCLLYLLANMMLCFQQLYHRYLTEDLCRAHAQFVAFSCHTLERQQAFKNYSYLSFTRLKSLCLDISFCFILIFSCKWLFLLLHPLRSSWPGAANLCLSHSTSSSGTSLVLSVGKRTFFTATIIC